MTGPADNRAAHKPKPNQAISVHVGTREIVVYDWEIQWSFARSSGAGGQNVNKVESKAILEFIPGQSSLPADVRDRFVATHASRLTIEGVLRITSELTRDRERNRSDCLQKLEQMIRTVARPPKIRRKTKPTRGSVERRLTGKKIRSENKAGRKKVDW